VSPSRPHPFDLLFGTFRAEHFPAIRQALGDERDVNAFVLAAPALELLRDLRPDEGFGDAVDGFVALVHAAYLFWCDGEQTRSAADPATRRLAAASTATPDAPLIGAAGAARYVQVAPRLIWGQLDPDAPFEPLDGWFSWAVGTNMLRVVACFGLHEQRPGVSVVVAEGRAPGAIARADGTPPFSPVMPGGNAAGLLAVVAPEELLLLAWRALQEEDESAWR
jgi:hypothetical protein